MMVKHLSDGGGKCSLPQLKADVFLLTTHVSTGVNDTSSCEDVYTYKASGATRFACTHTLTHKYSCIRGVTSGITQ
jgi:hypothetical protein